MVTFDVVVNENTPENKRKIFLKKCILIDVSDNFLRSTQSRVKYKGHNFALFNAPEIIKKGDIIIKS